MVQVRIDNAMSVDVEDYFQAHALSSAFPRARWDECECRVEKNIECVLQLFSDANVIATFFTLGWIGERYPQLVRRIVASGHELGSHGYDHTRADRQKPAEFREDIRKTKRILEEAGCCSVVGYRAASFSIGSNNQWAFDVLEQEGYKYSSSIYPISHDHYGMVEAPRFPFYPTRGALLEIPIATVQRFGRRIPCGGGGYFRLMPYSVFRANLRHINYVDRRPGVFYFHPWELDPFQPHATGLPWRSRIRHYLNLGRMEGRISTLLSDFSWTRMDHLFLRRTDGVT
jgi:polysaccharide deacetylase family protein (PEP-CTERM system associated)